MQYVFHCATFYLNRLLSFLITVEL